jgi:hypothetical protein
MQCGGFGWNGQAGSVTVNDKLLTFNGQCPFQCAWHQERFVIEERTMLDSGSPSRACWHDYPNWLYEGMRLAAPKVDIDNA